MQSEEDVRDFGGDVRVGGSGELRLLRRGRLAAASSRIVLWTRFVAYNDVVLSVL
jgi:hypothetical protein